VADEFSQAYADWIQSYSWDFYSTVTFRKLRRDPLAAAGAVWDTLYNKFSGTRAFVAAEKHKLDGVHLHMLSEHAWERGQRWDEHSLWLYFFKAFGRARVEVASSDEAVANYCAKYVTKGGPEAYTLWGDKVFWAPGLVTRPAGDSDPGAAEPVATAVRQLSFEQPVLLGLDKAFETK